MSQNHHADDHEQEVAQQNSQGLQQPEQENQQPETSAEAARMGVAFTLEGVDEITFVKILNDIMHEDVFKRPLSVQASEPQEGSPAALLLTFPPAHEEQGNQAVQRLKTVLLRYNIQIDSVREQEN